MRCKPGYRHLPQRGIVLAITVIFMVILMTVGFGMLNMAYGTRLNAIRTANKTIAMMAAEAGYEKAVFWMSQQFDVLYVMKAGGSYSDSLNFANSWCNYEISFFSFLGSRPIYKIKSTGCCGRFKKTLEVLVAQAIVGWESPHTIPTGPSSTTPWPFSSSETINIPIHVNKHDDIPDVRDIYIIQGGWWGGSSVNFQQKVSFGESRYTSTGSDKYSSVMKCFTGGVVFDQPDSKVNQSTAVARKMERFRNSTNSMFKFKPVNRVSGGSIAKPNAAVQLEFFVESGTGKVRITNNCTVRGYRDSRTWGRRTYDYKINDSGGSADYEKYDIYAYHIRPTDEVPLEIPIADTYVTQSIGGAESEPGGQIFVDGNVIIGGNDSRHFNDQLIKGKITVAATGNIWVADSIKVDGNRDGDLPALDNPNVIGLFAQGVVKVVDPGMSDYSYVDDKPKEPDGFEYVPVARPHGSREYRRKLSYSMIVEAGITVGGGGWGAENVGQRKTSSSGYDKLIVRGAISEASRGIVGTASTLSFPDSSNGYQKSYHFDKRMLMGILPGDIWMQGKYLPTPAGWKDY